MKGLFKKCLIIITLLMLFKAAAVVSAAAGSGGEDFIDIKGHWAENTIKEMVSRGWIKGVPTDGQIRIQPEKNISRAEFITVLYRTGKIPEAKGEPRKFSDVPEGAWFKEALDMLSACGLVNGYDDGTFRPDVPINRAEIASILCRAAGWESRDNIDKISSLKAFSDVSKDKWYYNSVMINKLMGVINGYPDGTFGAMNKATRAEAFSMISRFAAQAGTSGSQTVAGKEESGTGEGKDNMGNQDAGNESNPGAKPDTGKISDSVGFIAYDVTGKAGDMVLYQVYGYGMKNLGNFDIKLSYNPEKVVAEAVVKGTIKEGNYLNADLSTANEGYIIVSSSGGSPSDDTGRGIVFIVMFRAKTAGKTAVSISGANGKTPELYNAEGRLFENVTVENGSITVK